jgi:peptide/nickel transport system permease protein
MTAFEAAPPEVLAAELPKDRKRGQLRDIWRRYRKNKLALVGLTVVGILIFIAIFEPFISPYDATQLNTANTTAQPDAEHWFGTDKLGRDYFSMTLYGTKLAIIVGLCTMVLSLVVGVALGALAGYRGRFMDTVIMRITDVFLSFPPLIAAIILVRAVGSGIEVVILALSVLGWTTSARLMRGQTLALRESEYVEAARSIGASDTRIVMRHILPNAIGPVLILAFSGIGVSIVAMASLAYLGIGVPPQTPEWGRMIADALPYARIPGFGYLWVFPSLSIVITTLAFAFVADGLRDALDPKLR